MKQILAFQSDYQPGSKLFSVQCSKKYHTVCVSKLTELQQWLSITLIQHTTLLFTAIKVMDVQRGCLQKSLSGLGNRNIHLFSNTQTKCAHRKGSEPNYFPNNGWLVATSLSIDDFHLQSRWNPFTRTVNQSNVEMHFDLDWGEWRRESNRRKNKVMSNVIE